MFDVIVVGGGPAGLSAALMLGRCRRRVLVCDTGEPRNRWSRALHGYLTRDGVPPASLLAIGRDELAPYGVEYRRIAVLCADRDDGGFDVSLADGVREHTRFLLIATGVRDALPPIPGFAECYGRSAFHCPYCDGWEWRTRRLAVVGPADAAAPLALSLRTWSDDVVLCAQGVPRRTASRLARNGIGLRTDPIVRFEHQDGLLAAVHFAQGPLARDAVFFAGGQSQQSEIVARLGCAMTPRGTVKTGQLSGTNVPGVFVAGDASRDAQFAVVAAGEGLKAAVAINKALQKQERVP